MLLHYCGCHKTEDYVVKCETCFGYILIVPFIGVLVWLTIASFGAPGSACNDASDDISSFVTDVRQVCILLLILPWVMLVIMYSRGIPLEDAVRIMFFGIRSSGLQQSYYRR